MVYSHPLASPLLAPQVPPRLPPQSLFPRSTPQHLGRPSSSPSPGFPSSPSNSSGTDFLPTLTLFLKSLSTSLSIPALAPNLLNAGVDSKEKFILLLSLTENSLSRCIEDLCEKEGVSKLQRLLLTKALKEARGKALGVEETKEEAKS
ncbi:hypothetical protein BCR35DRAFT_304594 [Leucosporidium creatinivorum]|uniref:Uncharacterized protein n=1 Tax=Leucosporidium creatinivorum TaxID=106004 RepID=A0A1Y2F8U0_9BASI|nr:hypothetical protein BCR35DRAFT_304594 [Leucosporidium creatinivorum]